MAKRLRFGFIALLALLGAYNLVTGQLNNFADDPGVGWHLKTGEMIVNFGFVPQYDPFLSSEAPRPWVSDQWLSDVIVWLVFSAGGWPLIYAVFTSLFILTFFVVLFRVAYRFTQNSLASSLAVMVAFKLAEVHFILRPVVFSFLPFVLVYLLLYKLEFDYRAKKLSLAFWPLFLPLLFVLWANLHPSFTIGLTLFAILVGAALLRCFSNARNIGQFALILALFVGSVAVTIATPYALELHRSILTLAHSSFFMSYHMEWLPPKFGSFEGELLLFSLAILLVAFVVRNKSIPLGCFEIISVIIFAFLATRMIRTLPYFGIVASIPLAASLVNLGSPLFFVRSKLLRSVKASLRKLALNDSASVFFPVLVAVALPLITMRLNRVPFFSGDYGPTQAQFPVAAVESLNAVKASKTVLSVPEWGGYLTYFGQQARPIIDDRNSLLGENFYKSYFREFNIKGNYLGYIACVAPSHILLPVSDSLVARLREIYPVRFEDRLSIIFEPEQVAPRPAQCDNIVNSDKL